MSDLVRELEALELCDREELGLIANRALPALIEYVKAADALRKRTISLRDCCGAASTAAQTTGKAVICMNCPHLGAELDRTAYGDALAAFLAALRGGK